MTDLTTFPQTTAALEALTEALSALRHKADSKAQSLGQQRQNYRQNMSIKSAQLEIFSTTTTNALDQINQVVRSIDEVLNEDGSGHNNN